MVAYLADAVRWGQGEPAELSGPEADAGGRFVTAVVAGIPGAGPVVHLISCGHPEPPLLRHATATRTMTALTVPDPAPPLGLRWPSDTPFTR